MNKISRLVVSYLFIQVLTTDESVTRQCRDFFYFAEKEAQLKNSALLSLEEANGMDDPWLMQALWAH